MSQAQQGKDTSLLVFGKKLTHICRGCGYSSRHRYLYERHTKHCAALASGEIYDPSVPRGRVPQLVHRNYRCKQCNFTTTKSKLFLAHRRAVHGDVIKIYPCDICEYASKYKSKLLRHRNLKHKGAGDYSEENAGYMSEETAGELLHSASNHLHIALTSNGDNGVHNSSNTLTIALDKHLGEQVLNDDYKSTSPAEEYETVRVKLEPSSHGYNSPDDGCQTDDVPQHCGPTQNVTGNNPADITRAKTEIDNAFSFISEANSSSGRTISQCTLCNYSNIHKWKVANHVRSFHMKKKLFRCPECDFVTGRKIEFCVHKAKTHATSKVYSCSECSYCTISRTNYERHINNHVGGGPIKCTYCSYSSTGEAAVIRHMQEYHPKQQMTPSSLKKPQPTSNSALPRSSCTTYQTSTRSPDESGFNTNSYMSYPSKAGGIAEKTQKPGPVKRVGSHILSFAKSKTGNEVDCPVCGITFKTDARLRIHMVSHSDEATHHCPLCTLKYKRTSDLNRHMKKKHNAKLRDFFYMGMQEQPLNLSVRSDDSPSVAHCKLPSSLGDRDQPLDLSVKPRVQGVQINNLPAKTPKGPYSPEELKCSLCSYMAKWPSDLKRHALVHSMEKRFKCDQCDRRYKYQFDLNMHVRRSHHMTTSKPNVSTKLNIFSANETSSSASSSPAGGMTLPTQVPLSPPSIPTALNLSPSPLAISPRVRSSSVPLENSTEDSSSPMASLRPLLPTPSPPSPPIRVSARMEVVFAPSSIHDMENTLPPSMQRVADPIGTLSDASSPAPDQESSEPASEQPLLEFKQEIMSDPSVENTQGKTANESKNAQSHKLPPPAKQSISGAEQKPPRMLKMKALKPQRLSSLTSARKFKCKYCPYLGLYQSEVDRHTRLHTGEKPYKCVYCVYSSAWKGDMKRHVVKHHAAEISMADSLENIIEYCCNLRTDENDSENSGQACKNEKVADSDACEEFQDEEAVADQIEKSDGNRIIHVKDGKVDELECEEKRTTSSESPETGELWPDADLDYNGNKQSSGLSLSASSNSIKSGGASEEIADVLDSKLLQCPHCPFACDVLSKMKSHAGIHVDLRRFRCEYCGKRSNWMWDIRKHIRKDHPGKEVTAVLMSEQEAQETLKDYLNNPVFRTLSRNSPGRNSPVIQSEVHRRDSTLEEDSDTAEVETLESSAKREKSKSLTDKEDDVEDETKSGEKTEENSTVSGFLTDLMINDETRIDDDQEVSIGRKKYRPYKCSLCPRRSNWRWDIMKHIRKIHPVAKMITLSEEVAKATFSESVMKRPKGQGLKALKKAQKANQEQEDKKEKYKCKEVKTTSEEQECDKVANIPFKKRRIDVKEEKQSLETNIAKLSKKKIETIPKAFNLEAIPKSPKKSKIETIRCKANKDGMKAKYNNIPGADKLDENRREGSSIKPVLRCLKRYKCYYCPYRSNYRSDIGRHGKRLHRKQQLKVVILDEEEAASTLHDYRQKYAKKKFVLTANTHDKDNRRKGKKQNDGGDKEQPPKNSNRPIQDKMTSESAELTKPSSIPSGKIQRQSSDQQSSRILFDQSNVLPRNPPTDDQADDVPTGTNQASSLRPEKRKLFRCELCPYVANSVEGLKKHTGYHEPNSDSKFVCKRCPYYCTSKIELGIHAMVHAMQKKSIVLEDKLPPEKKAKLDKKVPEAKATTPRSRMSPFKKSPSFSPSQKHKRKSSSQLIPKERSPQKQTESNSKLKLKSPENNLNKSSPGGWKKKRNAIYKCDLCPYNSHWQANLNAHNKRHIPGEDRPFECEECPYYAPNNTALANHRRVHLEANQDDSSLEMDGSEVIDVDDEYEEENEGDDNEISRTKRKEAEIKEKKNKKRSIQAVCALCPQTFTFKGNIYRHMKLHTASADRPYKCNFCSLQVSNSWTLDAHLRLHTGTTEAADNSIDYNTEDDSIVEETENTTEECETSEKKYSCERCPYVTDHRRLMKVHIDQHEPSAERQACCDYCPYYVTTRKALSRHMLIHKEYQLLRQQENADNFEDDEEENEEEPMRKCKICPYTTNSSHSLRRHMEFHSSSEDRQVQCPYCSYFVKSQARLSTHITVHPEHVQQNSDIEKIKGSSVGEDNKRTTRPDHPYVCTQCPYTTKYFENFERHRSAHVPGDERPYKCPYCPFFVKQASGIGMHIKLHQIQGSTPSSPVHVEKLNVEKPNIEKPNVEKTKSNPTKTWVEKYRCTICPYRACDPKYFKRHLELHEPDEDRPLQCPDCPFYVKTKTSLWRHSMLHEVEADCSASQLDDEEIQSDTNKEIDESVDGDFIEDADEIDNGLRKKTPKKFVCQICPYQSVHSTEIQKHKENHQPSVTRQAKCKYCPYYLATFHGLTKHMLIHPEHRNPSNKSTPTKDDCNVSSSAEINTELKAEVSENGADSSTPKSVRCGRKCPLCPYVAHPAKMKAHQVMHSPSEDRKTKCPYCPFYVKGNKSLGGHIALHTTRAYASEMREADTGDESDGETSVMLEEDCDGYSQEKQAQSSKVLKPKRHRCSYCPYTGRRCDVDSHMLAHMPDEKYIHKCDFCNYSASHKAAISSHSKVHNPEYIKEMRDQYHVCSMATGDPIEDEDEEEDEDREQTGEESLCEVSPNGEQGVTVGGRLKKKKKYKCKYCPYYGRKTELETHMLAHQPNEKHIYKCRLCTYGAMCQASVNSHLKVHNPDYLINIEAMNILEPYIKPDVEDIGDEDGQRVHTKQTKEDKSSDESDSEPSALNGNKMTKGGKVNRNKKLQCSYCPYIARKDVMEAHIPSHKPNPKNTFNCEVCSFTGSNKVAINCHMKVHQPDYVSNMMAMYEVQLDTNQFPDFTPPSPAKSDISDVSDCDVIEMANIKQQLITAKIVGVQYDADRFQFGTQGSGTDKVESVFIDQEGDMKPGLIKKMYKCKFCPLKHIHREKIKLHKEMHKQPGRYSCLYCTYRSGHKILRNRHMKVHAFQYKPGIQEINDYQCLPGEETEDSEGDPKEEEEDMEVSFKVTDEKKDTPDSDKDKMLAAVKSPNGNSIRINSKPLAMTNMPPGVEYYVRKDSATGQNYLERASVGKWCCEKCPYATMSKDFFENHAMLHASHQRYVCEYCDYSVPVYSFLLMHRKLHLQPNTNLLAMQSITNLLSLPEVPADVAAAADFPGCNLDPISQFGTHDHMELFENGDQYSEPRKLYRCDRCPYTNVRRDNLLAHLRFHMVSSELKCDYCDYSVSKHEMLVQHIKVHFVDPNNIKLDVNSNPIRSAVSPPANNILKEAANGRSPTAKRTNIKVSTPKTTARGCDDQDMNNNSSNWVCQYCDREFNASDRLLRHEMQHLIGQPVS